jgi:hypothetical protein
MLVNYSVVHTASFGYINANVAPGSQAALHVFFFCAMAPWLLLSEEVKQLGDLYWGKNVCEIIKGNYGNVGEKNPGATNQPTKSALWRYRGKG